MNMTWHDIIYNDLEPNLYSQSFWRDRRYNVVTMKRDDCMVILRLADRNQVDVELLLHDDDNDRPTILCQLRFRRPLDEEIHENKLEHLVETLRVCHKKVKITVPRDKK